ncbi:MAG: hypothetical protein ACP5LF_03705 [Nitrososphaeria archaeon]|nr:hypothetical protein [Conexivisphaerales archaeon]
MGRVAVLFGIWLIGYVIGFIGYIVLAQTNAIIYLVEYLSRIFGNSQIVAAGLVGLATSFLSLAVVVAWSYWSPSKV